MILVENLCIFCLYLYVTHLIISIYIIFYLANQFITKHSFTIKKWCGVYIKICFYSLLQKYAFGAVIDL